MQSFLQQKSAKGDANYIRLGITDIKNPAMWKGVVWSDGRAISIDWKDKELAGELDLNGSYGFAKGRLFTQSVDGDSMCLTVLRSIH